MCLSIKVNRPEHVLSEGAAMNAFTPIKLRLCKFRTKPYWLSFGGHPTHGRKLQLFGLEISFHRKTL